MPLDYSSYMIRRKLLKIFGASFHVYNPQGEVVGFSSQKAFKLKEDIRVYTDESQSTEILSVQARQIIDFSAAYDIVDSQSQRKIGAARRKGWSSIVRDSWEVLDENDQPIAMLKEDSMGMAMVRRFLTNLIPQRFHLADTNGNHLAEFRQRFNLFIYKLDVTVAPESGFDPRLALGVGVLISAIEGRQG